jgi:hypothetical protein
MTTRVVHHRREPFDVYIGRDALLTLNSPAPPW